MKILNLYAGIGGNRKLWENCDITAVEYDPDIAEIYHHYYPDDELIISDAHAYLLENYKRFDYIWSSPPCPSHSDIRRMAVVQGQYPAVYPDIRLWEEVTLLKHYAKNQRWTVENVIPYYDPIVEPAFKLDRHLFWANFYAAPRTFTARSRPHKNICGSNHIIFGYDISKFKVKNKRQLLRNMVNPEVGQYILDYARRSEQKTKQMRLF